jgi:casein kinase 1
MPPYPQVIGNWFLWETLGSGFSGDLSLLNLLSAELHAFTGSIFKASHVHTGQVVALKVQNVDHECPTNRYERGLYPSLQGGIGMPTLWAAGVEGMWDYLAIDLLGPSLDTLYRKMGQDSMDLRSVCCIAMQVVSGI